MGGSSRGGREGRRERGDWNEKEVASEGHRERNAESERRPRVRRKPVAAVGKDGDGSLPSWEKGGGIGVVVATTYDGASIRRPCKGRQGGVVLGVSGRILGLSSGIGSERRSGPGDPTLDQGEVGGHGFTVRPASVGYLRRGGGRRPWRETPRREEEGGDGFAREIGGGEHARRRRKREGLWGHRSKERRLLAAAATVVRGGIRGSGTWRKNSGPCSG
ncbi:hypothetical protein Scep_018810 [Stephania cephalantha]|uniref:Uncharacterized protein n=1 Tax=Stephania cephalantha TaxID=152367 RepID=A0AAP0I9K8_9MAGN